MILNRNNVPLQEQRLFLGPELGLQRYDDFKYPVFFELFTKQRQFFWSPEEIDVQKDRVDYESLAPHEKHIFTSNLLFQTLMDSVVGRGVNTFSKYISSPELEACFNAWQFFETIHSFSYTYIIKNLYPNPSALLDQALLIPAIADRIDSVCNSYEELDKASGEDVKKKIYLALISVNILEAVRFYVSFVCAFAFAENKKMIGNADIIRLIKRDESCFDELTEVLTQDGWKQIQHLLDSDKIAQYNQDGSVDFVIPYAIINKEYVGELYHLTNPENTVDMMLTPDHRFIYWNSNKEVKEKQIKDVKFTEDMQVIGVDSFFSSIPISTNSIIINQIPHNGRVYCVSVPSGMILIRRNNCIAVSGNCHLSITQNLINILRTKEEEGFFDTIKECEEEAIKMFAEAANEEKAWANYLFKDGSILGLNAELLGKYIEWLVDSRMSTIGLPKIFNTKNNGLGTWVTAWMESEKVQVAPQESGITNYRISAGNNDVQTMIFESEEL